MKRWMAAALTMLLVFCLLGCQKEPLPQPTEATQPPVLTGPVVGICLPEKNDLWQENETLLREAFSQLDYPVEVTYADNDPLLQAEQIEDFAEQKVAALVVAPVDSMELTESLSYAQQANIPVVSYDRHLMDTETVDALVTFDYEDMGRQIGEYIVTEKKLDQAEEEQRSYYVEFFMGAAHDDTARLFHAGLLGVLQPYLDTQVLKSGSDRTSFADTYVVGNESSVAGQKLQSYLELFYQKTALDILCLGADSMTEGCLEAMASYGWKKDVLITGLGGSEAGVQQVAKGKQTATIYKDYPQLARRCAQTVNALFLELEVSFDTTMDNQAKDVPTVLVRSVLVDKENYKKELVDTGIYDLKDEK